MNPSACYCTQARRTALALTDLYDAALAPSGLKVTQFALLRLIRRLDGPSLTLLARAMGLDRSTLGRNLRVLERRGLVDLAAGHDARARSVALTAAGRAALLEADPEWDAVQARIEAALPPDALQTLGTLAETLGALRQEGAAP